MERGLSALRGSYRSFAITEITVWILTWFRKNLFLKNKWKIPVTIFKMLIITNSLSPSTVLKISERRCSVQMPFIHALSNNNRMLFRLEINSLSDNPTKWLNVLKQFVGKSWRIVWVCLTILWGCRLKG